jgi:hypothetical protein
MFPDYLDRPQDVPAVDFADATDDAMPLTPLFDRDFDFHPLLEGHVMQLDSDVTTITDDDMPLPPLIDPDLDPQPLLEENVRQLDGDAARITNEIIEAHVEGTYTPGYTIRPPQALQKRQQRRPRGYPCIHDNCDRVFNRSCERT